MAYLVETHFELDGGESSEVSGRHSAMCKRALRDGAKVHLGRAGYGGTARLADPLAGDMQVEPDRDYGWLLHGPDFAGDRRMRFFRAVSIDGRIAVPVSGSPLLLG